MKWSTVLPLAVSAIALIPSTGAWKITWHDGSDEEHSRTGHGPSKCIEIDNPEGNVFKIDAQGEEGIKMLLFLNDSCKGKAAGSATDEFTKESSRDLRGFKVVHLSTHSSNTTATTESSTSHDATSTKASSTHTKASSTRTKSVSSVHSTPSTTTQTSAATSSAGTQTSGQSSATVPSASTSPATTSNAAVQMGVLNGNAGVGLVGGVLGLAIAPWMI